MSDRLKILFISAEVNPLAKTGGLGDVAGALPPALRRLGHDVRMVMPGYGFLNLARYPLEVLSQTVDVPMGYGSEPAWLGALKFTGDTPLYLVWNQHHFGRERIYGYSDDDGRFLYFTRAALELVHAVDFAPDIVHCNDWHTAMAPHFLKAFHWQDPLLRDAASVLTIHNIAYQGICGWDTLKYAGLSHEGFIPSIVREQDQRLNIMARGILFAEAVNAVSPRYAQEIMTPEFGEGLDPLLRLNHDKVYGILNGIDFHDYDPARDRSVPRPYSVDTLDRKADNKRALQSQLGLHEAPERPLLAFISRLVEQKGIDLITPVLDRLFEEQDVQIVVLASGEGRYEHWFHEFGERWPGRAAINLRFDEALARRIYAGADMFLMPSRFEPCGLSQMISLRYGTVPIVRRTGGLADTVADVNPFEHTGTGFVFDDYHPLALHWAVTRALETFRHAETWRRLQQRGMAVDNSWEASAQRYVEMYRRALERKAEGLVGARYP